MSVFLLRKIDVIVVSYGGVGTTFFLEYLSKFLKTNHPLDYDGLKHQSIPPISLNRNLKFIYIYGDPQYAVVSFFRRKYYSRQSKKLLKFSEKKIAPIPGGLSLEQYANEGIDRFQFESHFTNWFEKYLYRPTLFVKYENIFNNIEKISNFLELNSLFIEDFPERKKRESSLNDLSEEIFTKLDDMYGAFAARLNALEDIVLRSPSEIKTLPNFIFMKPYSSSAIVEVGHRLTNLLR